MVTALDLVRRELQLRDEIATHELACMLEDDDADPDAMDIKAAEITLIRERRDALDRSLRAMGLP